MKNTHIKYTGKRTGIVSVIVTFLLSVLFSMHIILNYSKLYDDKQYADMITCSESLSSQIYNAMMRSLSRGSPLAEVVTAKGEEAFRDTNQLESIKYNTSIRGFLYAPDGNIVLAYPEDLMQSYIGLNLSENFPEKISKEILHTVYEPLILGPFSVPDSEEKALAVVNPFFKTGKEGRQYAGNVVTVVDYPDIFKDIDFREAEKRNVLCRIWRYNEFTSEIQTILETKDKFPDEVTRNNTTFKKVYFTSPFNYSFVPKYSFWQSRGFYQLAIGLFIVDILLSIAVYFMIRGIGYSHELKLYKVQNKLLAVQEHTIISLSNLVENRDSDTGEHVRRTSDYVYMLAKETRKAGFYTDILTDDYIEILKNAAPMHDIGKIVVPDAVLKKPGKLTPEEFDLIKLHTTEGGKIINDILGPVQTPEFVLASQQIAESHHEKWNGKGYPKGLAEQEIPLSARMMSLADVFDALTTPRCYKEPFPFEKAIEIIKEDSGISFDPQLTEVFLNNQDKLREIMKKW